ncbi:alpha/beta fold hydrolase [Micromonospora sp. B11E3]|uniref:alpha/beta hydrolase family protein n=1 Tax=Micromonospora sp. B11E3 TaxID=3153562 RepID=UPI00325D0E86
MPIWTDADAQPGWRMLGWADRHHLARWRRAHRSLVELVDAHTGAVSGASVEVLGRPVSCRTSHRGHLEVLVALNRPQGAALYLYRSDTDSYLPVPDISQVRGIDAWDPAAALFAVGLLDGDPTVPAGVHLYRYDHTGCTPVPLPTTGGIRPVAAAGQRHGLLALTGLDPADQLVPGVYDTISGAMRWFGEHVKGSSVELAPSGAALLTTAWTDQRHTYTILDLTGRATAALYPEPGLATDVRLCADERHLLGWYQSPAAAPAFTRWALPTGEARPWRPAARARRAPALRWQHRTIQDGAVGELPEWVFQPTVDSHGGIVLFLHGGPRGLLKQEYDPVIAALTQAGWTVIGLNYPGSSGYGPHFRERSRGDWGGVDAAAVTQRLHTLHREVAGQPVCVYGQSYGAYLALLLASEQPHLLAAAAVWAPVTDLPALCGAARGVRQRWLAAELGELRLDPQRLWQRSPISRAQALARTRLLVGHGRHDDRCPVEQSHRLVERIRALPHAEGYLRYLEDTGGHTPVDWPGWCEAVLTHFARAHIPRPVLAESAARPGPTMSPPDPAGQPWRGAPPAAGRC